MKFLATSLAILLALSVVGHAVGESDAQFVANIDEMAVAPFTYLGAKHMITGYDHLLFIAGVIFYLYRLRDIALYVSLFTIGHSLTLLAGVTFGTTVNVYLVDAIIGLSIVYKAFENLGGFKQLFNVEPNPRIAVFIFGLFHGLGLATKLQELVTTEDGLFLNLVFFNVGVEIGQVLALLALFLLLFTWRHSEQFVKWGNAANVLLLTAGFLLTGYQLAGFVNTTA